MKPLDPRLLKYAKPAKRYIIQIACLGIVISGLVIAQSFLISGAASPVITHGARLESIIHLVGWLALVVIVRAALLFWRESQAHRAADETIAQLRHQVISKSIQLGPRWRATHGSDVATLVTRGLGDLEPYFVRYLPQLILVCTVTPATLLTILLLDFWSALVAALTIPLIPIFMVLIGKLTQSASRDKLAAMEHLGSQLLDLLAGLPTLRAIGREKGPRASLVKLSKRNTRTTMQTLRVAFLSGGVLEFLATLSVALVAVQVGFRMVAGDLDLFRGLAIIMLAPEVFEPLRQVGAQFHASANGVAAAEATFKILETTRNEELQGGTVQAPDLSKTTITIDGLSVAARGAWAPDNLSAQIRPGTITALAGSSGAGKTTTAMVLLKLEAASSGRILVGDLNLDQIDANSWWKQTTWVPQSPLITIGSVADNVGGDLRARQAAAEATGFAAVVSALPNGWDTALGEGGIGLSVGQRQRLALTKALVSPTPLLVLDEPTAHLDALSEEQIISVIEELRRQGTTVIVIAHRQAVLAAADLVIPVSSRPDAQAVAAGLVTEEA